MPEMPIKLTSIAEETLQAMRPSARLKVLDLLKTKLIPFVETNAPVTISGLDGDFWVLQAGDDGPVVVATVHGDVKNPSEYVVTAVLHEEFDVRNRTEMRIDRGALELGREVLSHSTKVMA